jgi:hypothetical protein
MGLPFRKTGKVRTSSKHETQAQRVQAAVRIAKQFVAPESIRGELSRRLKTLYDLVADFPKAGTRVSELRTMIDTL